MKRILYTLLLCLAGGYASAQCNPVITISSGNNFICDGSYEILVASPGDTYQWYKDGNIINGAQSNTCYITQAGNYTVEVDSVGCISMSTPVAITVNIGPQQPGLVSGPDTVCSGGVYTYTTTVVSGATAYAWQGISSTGVLGAPDTTILPSVTGNVYPGINGNSIVGVRALNDCASPPSTMQSVSVGPPQMGGSWTLGDVDVSDMQSRICPGHEYTLFPVMHGFAGSSNTDTYTFQWYLDNVPIAGATQWEYIITHGGNYKVEVITNHCGTFTDDKKVYQDLPNSITVSPAGPLSFCANNATPLTVSFDLAGVTDTINWAWFRAVYYAPGAYYNNTYSLMPDTSGYYSVWARSIWLGAGGTNCMVYSNGVMVTMPQPLEVTQLDDTLFATPGFDSYQWYESGMLLPGETQQQLTLTYDGLYTVEGVFMNGCVENSASFDPLFMPPPPPPPPGSNNPQEPGDEMTIAPNPVTGSFVLYAKTSKDDETADICITDAMGKILFEKKVMVVDGVVKEKIDLPEGVNFIGFLKLRSKSTGKTMKFNKQ